MKYNCLILSQKGKAFHLSTQTDDTDRVRTKAVPYGCPGRAWIYYPANTKRPEHYKKTLINHVRKQIIKEVMSGVSALDTLGILEGKRL